MDVRPEAGWKRLPLQGAVNVRELGGYPTKTGAMTRHGRMLRADSLAMLTASDVRVLRDYGVVLVLDLRGESEATDMPDVDFGEGVAYEHVELLDRNAAAATASHAHAERKSFSMERLYRAMLENTEAMGRCLRLIIDAPKGCVVFHCAVGKDRTGVLAMVLLLIAGVDRYDIIADYSASWPNLMRDEAYRDSWKRAQTSVYAPALRSDPEVSERILQIIEDEYGGIFGYLEQCGITRDEALLVRDRLLSD